MDVKFLPQNWIFRLRSMVESDTILLQELIKSYQNQLALYAELNTISSKLLSRLIMSRGDLSQIVDDMKKKSTYLQKIDNERKQIYNYITQWEKIKSTLHENELSKSLDSLLGKTQERIQEFLSIEDQLKKYLDGIMQRDTNLKSTL